MPRPTSNPLQKFHKAIEASFKTLIKNHGHCQLPPIKAVVAKEINPNPALLNIEGNLVVKSNGYEYMLELIAPLTTSNGNPLVTETLSPYRVGYNIADHPVLTANYNEVRLKGANIPVALESFLTQSTAWVGALNVTDQQILEYKAEHLFAYVNMAEAARGNHMKPVLGIPPLPIDGLLKLAETKGSTESVGSSDLQVAFYAIDGHLYIGHVGSTVSKLYVHYSDTNGMPIVLGDSFTEFAISTPLLKAVMGLGFKTITPTHTYQISEASGTFVAWEARDEYMVLRFVSYADGRLIHNPKYSASQTVGRVQHLADIERLEYVRPVSFVNDAGNEVVTLVAKAMVNAYRAKYGYLNKNHWMVFGVDGDAQLVAIAHLARLTHGDYHQSQEQILLGGCDKHAQVVTNFGEWTTAKELRFARMDAMAQALEGYIYALKGSKSASFVDTKNGSYLLLYDVQVGTGVSHSRAYIKLLDTKIEAGRYRIVRKQAFAEDGSSLGQVMEKHHEGYVTPEWMASDSKSDKLHSRAVSGCITTLTHHRITNPIGKEVRADIDQKSCYFVEAY